MDDSRPDGARLVRLSLDRDELRIVGNALNEVCHGLHLNDLEFYERIGAEREDAEAVLDRMLALRYEMRQSDRELSNEARDGGESPSVELGLTGADFATVVAVLNEVCSGGDIDDFEFHARIGADRVEARALLERLGGLLDESPPSS